MYLVMKNSNCIWYELKAKNIKITVIQPWDCNCDFVMLYAVNTTYFGNDNEVNNCTIFLSTADSPDLSPTSIRSSLSITSHCWVDGWRRISGWPKGTLAVACQRKQPAQYQRERVSLSKAFQFVHNCLSRPRCSIWVPSRNLFLRMLLALKGCMRAKAGVIMPRAHRDAIWMWYVLYKNGTLLLLFISYEKAVGNIGAFFCIQAYSNIEFSYTFF